MSGLPEGWVETTVYDAGNLRDAKRIPLNKSERSARPGPYPYYGANGLVDHVDGYLFEGEHVLLAEDGGNFLEPEKGVAYVVDGKFWVNNHAHIIEPSAGMSARFLCYWLNAVPWTQHVGGTTRLKLTQAGMKQASFPLPPLAEQRRIVEKLDALNAQSRAAATALTHIETLISRYKAAVLRAAFSDPKQSLRPTRLGDVLTGIKAGKNLRCVERPPLDHERGVVKVSAVTYGVFDQTQSKTLPKEFEPDPDTLIRAGDFLFSRANTIELVGACTIVDAAPRNLYLSDKILRLDMPDERKAWVDLFLKSPIGRAALEEASSGNQHSMRNISQKALIEIPIPLPPLEEQAEIVAGIEAAFAQIETLARAAAAAHARLSALDRAILSRAFQGKLVPQNPNDEPAGELLKRL